MTDEPETRDTDPDSGRGDDRQGSTDRVDRVGDLGDTVADSFVPLAIEASRVAGQVLFVAGRALVLGLALAVLYVTDASRRTQARRWLLLEGNRWTIIAGLVGLVFAGSCLLGFTGVIGSAEDSVVTSLFGGVVSGLFSFVPIVVAVNQLTVSQLFATPEDLRERIDSVHDFRVSIEGMLPGEPVSPTEPARFLGAVVEIVSQRATALPQACMELDDGDLAERIDEYVDVIDVQTTELDTRLGEQNLRLIRVLLPMMGDSYSENVNVAREIQDEHGDVLSDSANEILADLRDLFVAMDVIRQYYKALYLQQELSHLSRLIAYSGITSLLVSVFQILAFANGAPLPNHPFLLHVIVSASLAVAFSPFAVLFSFILRIATIVKRTAAPGAFTPKRETPAHVRRNRWQ